MKRIACALAVIVFLCAIATWTLFYLAALHDTGLIK